MYPYLHIGSLQLGTFGILLWLAAVAGIAVLQKTFTRDGVDADALNIVTLAVICGVIGAKLWHELQNPAELAAALHQIGLPGWSHPGQVVMGFLRWFQAGFAWFGGLLAAIAMLLYQGVKERPNGLMGWRAGLRMLDLAAPAAAIGYGVGRIGCLTSGDGDYGKNTASTFWGVHMRPDALVPPASAERAGPAHAAVGARRCDPDWAHPVAARQAHASARLPDRHVPGAERCGSLYGGVLAHQPARVLRHVERADRGADQRARRRIDAACDPQGHAGGRACADARARG